MRPLLIIFAFGFFISCTSFTEERVITESQIIHDTVKITEKIVDTIYIDSPIKIDLTKTEFYIQERLPEWFLRTKMLNGVNLQNDYKIENRLNPLYLEADFNGDNYIDLAIPIKHIKTEKVGFAIIHQQTHEVFIIGAGKEVKGGLSDNVNYIDIWKINRNKTNLPGLDENDDIDKNGPLFLVNPSIQVEKSEVGGGQVYWNGKTYVYFHQTY